MDSAVLKTRPAGKGLASWLSFVVYNCEFVTFPLISWVSCGTWLYRFLIFAALLVFSLARMEASWERADLLALFCVMFSCVFVTFPCGVLGQLWYLIVSLPDFCTLTYFFFSSHGGFLGKCWPIGSLVCDVFLRQVFVAFPRGVLGQVWCLIVSILIFVFFLTFLIYTYAKYHHRETTISIHKLWRNKERGSQHTACQSSRKKGRMQRSGIDTIKYCKIGNFR